MRRAVVVGVDNYQFLRKLYGCASDARLMKDTLSKNYDGSPNFHCELMSGSDADGLVDRHFLETNIEKVFSGKGDVSILYFSGHGYIDKTGGYLCTSTSKTGRDGVPLSWLMTVANQSKVLHRIIILDSCHSGAAAEDPLVPAMSHVSEGVSVLTASTAEQPSVEQGGAGLFTGFLVEALSGAAASLTGDVTPAGIYSHIDQALGPWGQRPTFKTNEYQFISLRKACPPIELAALRRLPEFFPIPEFEFQLDPGFEPERQAGPDSDLPPPDPAKNAIFAILQKYNRLNLLVPIDAPSMWHAAVASKPCRLTLLGEHYRNLAAKGRF